MGCNNDKDGPAITTNFIVAKLDGSTWTLPQVTNNGIISIDIADLTSFSEFAVGEAGGPIPSVGDYRSATGFGYWNQASSWQTFNGLGWVAASQSPTAADNNITIKAGHGMYVTEDVTVDQLVTEAGSQFSVGAFGPATLTIADGPGVDFTLNGELIAVYSTAVLDIAGNAAVAAGGTFYWGGNMHIGGNGGTGTLDFLAGANVGLSNNGFIHFDNGITINNYTNISFNSNGNNTTQFYFSGNNTTFNNYGTFNNSDFPGVHFNNNASTNASFNNKSTGVFNNFINTTTDFDGPIGFTNEGALNVNAGTFNLPNTTVFMSGPMTIGAGAAVNGVEIDYSSDTLTNNGTITGGFTFSSSAGQQVVNGAGSIGRLNVANSNGVLVNDIQTVTENLDLLGGRIITTEMGVVYTGPDVDITNATASNYVEGNLRRWVSVSGLVDFPIGDNANPAFITLNPVVINPGYIDARTTSGDHGQILNSDIAPDKTVNRTWTITPGLLDFSTCDVIFNWDASEVDGIANTANFIVGKYNGPVWSYPTVVNTTPTSITVTGITSFSDFQIGESGVCIVNIPDAAFKACLA